MYFIEVIWGYINIIIIIWLINLRILTSSMLDNVLHVLRRSYITLPSGSKGVKKIQTLSPHLS